MSNVIAKAVFGLVAASVISFSANAAQSFDAKAFQQSQAAGQTILIDVTAPWCPTCKQQRPTVQAFEKEKPDLVVYEVDFNSAKDTLKHFRVQYQSTLIVFRGSNEVGRSTGDTDATRIRALISKGF